MVIIKTMDKNTIKKVKLIIKAIIFKVTFALPCSALLVQYQQSKE